MLLGRVGFGREQRAAGVAALGRERGRAGGSFGASGIWESKGRGKKRRRCLDFGSRRRKWSRVSHCICGLGKNFAHELNVSVPKAGARAQCKPGVRARWGPLLFSDRQIDGTPIFSDRHFNVKYDYL